MQRLKHTIIPDPTSLSIWQQLRKNGFEALYCGGCVRDSLLDRVPDDWDITTSATPEDIEQIFPKTIPVGKAFGVMLVVENETEFEVATFRKDSDTSDGRRPTQITYSNAEEDVKRRDFTINGLLYNPESEEIIDYVGGLSDLEKGLIKAIGNPDQRFSEDHLRLLRAVRFAATLDFKMEEKTFQAVLANAALADRVSSERIAQELSKMLKSGKAGSAFRLLGKCGMLEILFPEIAALKGVEQPEEFHPEGDVWQHTLLMLDSLAKGCDLRLAYAVLLHDIGKPATQTFADRIRFNNHDTLGAEMSEKFLHKLKRSSQLIDDVTELVGGHMRMASLQKMRKAKLRRMLQDPLFPLHLELHRLDCIASHNKLEIYEFGKTARAEEEALPEPVKNIIMGRDLIEMGYKPSALFSKIIEKTQDEFLEGNINDIEEAREFVKNNFSF